MVFGDTDLRPVWHRFMVYETYVLLWDNNLRSVGSLVYDPWGIDFIVCGPLIYCRWATDLRYMKHRFTVWRTSIYGLIYDLWDADFAICGTLICGLWDIDFLSVVHRFAMWYGSWAIEYVKHSMAIVYQATSADIYISINSTSDDNLGKLSEFGSAF